MILNYVSCFGVNRCVETCTKFCVYIYICVCVCVCVCVIGQESLI